MLKKILTIALITIAPHLSPPPSSALTAPNCDFTTNATCDFTYTGTSQTIALPPGTYQFKAWGASAYPEYQYGLGGFTSGTINLETTTTFYVYVGGRGNNNIAGTGGVGGFNGGGSGGNGGYFLSECGGICPGGTGAGGATDFRLNNTLYSRIMVAGGGGGGPYNGDCTNYGGNGGGLSGANGLACSGTVYSGGTQTSGYSFGTGQTAINSDHNHAMGSDTNSGAGAGYWGGYTVNVTGYKTRAGGGGGSSYISGHSGAVAIASAASTTPRTGSTGQACTDGTTDIVCSYHYSGLIFTDTSTQSGSNGGNGKAQITCLSCTYLNFASKQITLTIPAEKVISQETITVSSSITVTTNWSNGFTLKVEMLGPDNRLIRTDPINGDTYINPTTDQVSTLDPNSWGIKYPLRNDKWRRIPPEGNPIILDQPAWSQPNGYTQEIIYGVRTSPSTIAGDYIGTIIYTVTPN
jgi:hypothetical protein